MMPPVGAAVPLPVTVPVTLIVELGETAPDMEAVVAVDFRVEGRIWIWPLPETPL